VAGGNSPEVFDFAEETFDQFALLVEFFVKVRPLGGDLMSWVHSYYILSTIPLVGRSG